MQFLIKRKKPKPVASIVMPGRRALGEGWQQVSIAIDDDKPVLMTRPVEAPPENRPIFVPAMGALEMEAIDFIMDGARYQQSQGRRHPSLMSPREYQKWIQERWLAFVEQKVRAFKGQSTFGPGGHTQRESLGIENWTGATPK